MKAVTIRCRALMVGDWCCDKHGFPMQITNVGEDYAYATWEDNEGDPWEFDDKDDQPEPIEITSDILKKNGWDAYSSVFPHNHKENFFIKDVGGTHLIAGRGNLSIWLDYEKGNDGIYADIVFPINYIHQLQQVLRLAGMTELANSFKI